MNGDAGNKVNAAPLVDGWRSLINKGQRDDLDSATH
jgi:hypothetical protein